MNYKKLCTVLVSDEALRVAEGDMGDVVVIRSMGCAIHKAMVFVLVEKDIYENERSPEQIQARMQCVMNTLTDFIEEITSHKERDDARNN